MACRGLLCGFAGSCEVPVLPLAAWGKGVSSTVFISHHGFNDFVRVALMLVNQVHQLGILFHISRCGLGRRDDAAGCPADPL